jgi:hypothetical protein
VKHQATSLNYNLYLNINLMVTLAVRALDLECVVTNLD